MMLHCMKSIIGVKYSNNAQLVLNALRRSRGLLTRQSVLLLFYYAPIKHMINPLAHISFRLHIT